ncbi:MAG: hypothetical protein M3017_04290 [Actinomycetota bacterium]|nr:hypothetical protein [Actinomycetota bacterium]
MGKKQRRSTAVPPGIRAALPGILLVMALGDQANRALEDLAGRVRSDPELARAFAGLAPDKLLVRLGQDPEFAAFHAGFQAFLADLPR